MGEGKGALTPIIHIYPVKSRFGQSYEQWACNLVVKRNFRLREVFGFIAGFADLLYTYTGTRTPAGRHKHTHAHIHTNASMYTHIYGHILMGTYFHSLDA